MSPQIDYVKIIITFLGGIGLFIYGMHIMASGLQKAAGNKMKRLLEILTKTKLLGVIVGASVTAIIQSSSATTVMVIGFVNAGLMNLTQSVGIIMGANIGTTITSWIVSSSEWSKYLNPVNIAPIAVGIGSFMLVFSKKERTKHIGEIVAGFGILFMGMNQMSIAAAPLRDSEYFVKAFVLLGSNPLLGILAGALVTGIIQSSSASVGILQSLAMTGLVPWNAAVYIIMGQNIGTCVTAILSSIGASKTAKSAAYVHLVFNVIGSIIFTPLFIIFFMFINRDIGNTLITGTEISMVHSAFNITNTIVLYRFSDLLIKLAKKLANAEKSEADEGEAVHLDDRVLETPVFAIQNCIKEIARMGYMALDNLQSANQALMEKDKDKIDAVFKREKSIDSLNQAITVYLVKLCNTNINEEQNNVITSLFHLVSDVERVGDHCENIAELAEYLMAEGRDFSDKALEELHEIITSAENCYKDSLTAFTNSDMSVAKSVLLQEQAVDDMEKKLRSSHIERLTNNECTSATGVVFLDMLTNLERITDHAKNIAESVIHLR